MHNDWLKGYVLIMKWDCKIINWIFLIWWVNMQCVSEWSARYQWATSEKCVTEQIDTWWMEIKEIVCWHTILETLLK